MEQEQAKVLTWETPPPRQTGMKKTSQWQAVYDELQAHPGESGYLGIFPKSGPGQFPIQTFKNHGYGVETRVCSDDKAKVRVWATYVPLAPDAEHLEVRE